MLSRLESRMLALERVVWRGIDSRAGPLPQVELLQEVESRLDEVGVVQIGLVLVAGELALEELQPKEARLGYSQALVEH